MSMPPTEKKLKRSFHCNTDPETHLQPCQISKMDLFEKLVSGFKPFSFFRVTII